MKIVQINCAHNGSTGNIAKLIHKQLLASGNQSYFFYGLGRTDVPNSLRIGNDFDLHTHAFLSRWTGLQGYYSHLVTRRVLKRIKTINPDIIHLHNVHGSYINLPMLFSYIKRSEIRTIITVHDCWLFTGKCPYFSETNCYRWKEKCGKCPQLSIYPKSVFLDRTVKTLKDKKKWLNAPNIEFITVSNWLKDMMKLSFLSNHKISCIPNGIDTSVFKPTPSVFSTLNGKFIILGVAAAWDKRKGLNRFIKLSSQLNENETIVLIGLTKQQIDGLPKNIIGIRNTENKQQLVEYYSRADVFVNFSLEETFGLVTAEAMACGCPVIAFNSTACGEIVNEDCGYVVETSEIDNIYHYIQRVKNKPFDRNKIAEYASRTFDQNIMVSKYLSEYKNNF